MMWFSNNRNTGPQQDVSATLASIYASGVELSIEELLPYQAKASLLNLAPKRALSGHQSGNYLARSKGRGMEFDEVRQYQNGDDIRTIDWRVTARTGKTYTKLFREEVERPVLIATDLSASMLFGSQLLFKSVQAAHIAALVAWHAKARGDRIGGIVFNNRHHLELKPRSRQAGVLHYLHALTDIHRQSLQHEDGLAAQMFEQNCARLRQLSRPGSLVYLITDGHQLSEDAVHHLSQISRHGELVVCLVSDPLEQRLPDSNKALTVALTDGRQRQQLTLGDSKTAERYRLLAQQFTSEQEQLLTKAGARLLHFCASRTLESQIKDGVASWIR